MTAPIVFYILFYICSRLFGGRDRSMIEVLFFVVILFGVFLQSSVGFGTVVTMPLGILLMGMGVTKPVVTFIALLPARRPT